MNQKSNNSANSFSRNFGRGARLATILLPVLAAAGCYRATGYERDALTAHEIPTVGGDRILGVKSMAGAGDYYIGNDFVALAVDGTPLAERSGIAGAPGGGSIVDVGYIELDTSYRRVPMPCDNLERMTSVVNQDPDISLIFTSFRAMNEIGVSHLEMHGQVHDPKRKLAGAVWDSEGFVRGVTAVTTISLGALDRIFWIETVITNNHTSAIDIRNIGDFVYQRGGGFRILAAANEDSSGAPLSTWGVNIPGTDFSNPLSSSVHSGPVAFMGTEPGANTIDCHITLGLSPLDSEQFLVASDPQDSLAETRPMFPERFVAGSLDTGVPLEPNASLTHRRRLHIKGGTSSTPEYQVYLFTQSTPNQATGILNDMIGQVMSLNDKKVGLLRFSLEGTATRSGPLPSELRFERYVGDGDPATDEEPAHWRLERLEWMEPTETTYSNESEYLFTPNSTFGVFLPEGTYRIVSKNRFQTTTLQVGTNSNNEDRPNQKTPITIDSENAFFLSERLSPERSDVLSPYGSRISYAQSAFYISTRANDSYAGFIQPLRFAISGLEGMPDPHIRRFRGIMSTYDPIAKIPRPTVGLPGWFHFTGGNSAFGVQIADGLPVWTAPGLYQVFGARGPLSTLESFRLDSRPGMGAVYESLTVFQAPLPEGWISFDTPGPSQTTSGGMLPCEQLASALADGVDVMARTEIDHQTDANALYEEFQIDLAYDEAYKTAIGDKPFVVGARTSNLGSYGAVTAYFTPADANARNGGARYSNGWTLADFLLQAEGKYNVVHRPRGPLGIFTQLGFDPALPLNQAAPWWNETGPISYGKINGGFDALEIISAGAIVSSGIDAWWSEYKAVRADWFALLGQQSHDSFTKAVAFSSGKFSEDTPVGLARTYLNIGDAELAQSELGPVLTALRSGVAVASTGPMLDVKVGDTGPGGLAAINGSPASITLDVTLVAPDWLPVDELRVVVNGQTVLAINDPKFVLTRSTSDSRYYTGTLAIPMPAGRDGWLVVEAGAPLSAAGPYRPGTPWNIVMKGIYPIAITNPIFLDLNGGGYTPPGL